MKEKPRYLQGIRKSDPEVRRVKEILTELNVRHRFFWSRKCNYAWGIARTDLNQIQVFPWAAGEVVDQPNGYQRFSRRRLTRQEFLSTVFHELSHILDYRENRYPSYLKGLDLKKLDQAKFTAWAQAALPAERSADRRGKKLLKKYFPKLTYKGSYDGASGVRFVYFVVSSVARFYGLKVPKGVRS